ncbi:MAG: hypothetical protein WC483_07415 [Candidatus Paceibacterota bacterium]
MEKFGFKEDEAISHPMITKSIESAQNKIEGINLDIRKHVLEYDDVLNQQRKAVYGKRQVLVTENDDLKIKDLIFGILADKLHDDLKLLDLKIEPVLTYLKNFDINIDESIIKSNLQNSDKLFNVIFEHIKQIYSQKEKDIANFNQIAQSVALNILDSL